MAGSSGSMYTAFIDIGLRGLDKVKSYMNAAVNAVQSSTSQISNSFLQSQQAITSFVGAANPLAMNTFGASVELLKARIGQSLTPYVMQASKAIQDLQNWIKGLDPETKKSIANWIMYGTAAAGAFYALSKGLDIMKAVAANPLALVLLAMGAAALKAASDMDRLNKSMDAAIERGERMKKGIYTEKEHKGSVAAAILDDTSMSKEEKIAKAKEMHAKLTGEAHQIAADNANDTFMKQAGTTYQWAKGMLGGDDQTQIDAKKIEGLNNQIKMLEDAINKLNTGEQVKYTAEGSIPKKKPAGGSGLMLGAMGGAGGGGGSIGSLDNAYSRINSGALGMNEIQREMLKIQQESLAETRETAGDTSSILDVLKRAAGL